MATAPSSHCFVDARSSPAIRTTVGMLVVCDRIGGSSLGTAVLLLLQNNFVSVKPQPQELRFSPKNVNFSFEEQYLMSP